MHLSTVSSFSATPTATHNAQHDAMENSELTGPDSQRVAGRPLHRCMLHIVGRWGSHSTPHTGCSVAFVRLCVPHTTTDPALAAANMELDVQRVHRSNSTPPRTRCPHAGPDGRRSQQMPSARHEKKEAAARGRASSTKPRCCLFRGRRATASSMRSSRRRPQYRTRCGRSRP